MTKNQATGRIWQSRVLGGLLCAVGFAFVVTSCLKMLNSDAAGNVLFGNVMSRSVSIFYYQIPVVSAVVSALWPYAPTPSLSPLLVVDNAIFAFFYFLIFVGHIALSRASLIARHVREVKEELRKDGLRRSMGGTRSAHGEIDVNITLGEDEGWVRTVHALYFAPLVVILIAAFLGVN
jgi:YniB-like protein